MKRKCEFLNQLISYKTYLDFFIRCQSRPRLASLFLYTERAHTHVAVINYLLFPVADFEHVENRAS